MVSRTMWLENRTLCGIPVLKSNAREYVGSVCETGPKCGFPVVLFFHKVLII